MQLHSNSQEEYFRRISPTTIIATVDTNPGDWKTQMDHSRRPGTTSPTTYFVYVENVDDAYQSALARGATSLNAPADLHHYERSAKVRDIVGNTWRFYTFKNSPSHFSLRGGLV